MSRVYLDTSALIKWYVAEPRSDEFEVWINQQDSTCVISSLTLTELRCTLARHQRKNNLNPQIVQQIYSDFEQDVQQENLILFPVTDKNIRNARFLIEKLPAIPLRSLDAIHLSIALDITASGLASADKVMLDAAGALGFECVRFD